jgi:hypothetical protein
MTLEQMIAEDPRFDGTRLVHLPAIGGTNRLVSIAISIPDAMKLFDPTAKTTAIMEPMAKFWKGWAPVDPIAWMPQTGDLIRVVSASQDHARVVQTIIQGSSGIFTVQPLSGGNKYDYDFSKQKNDTFAVLDWTIGPRAVAKNATPEAARTLTISHPPVGPKRKIPENRTRHHCVQCGGQTEMLFTSRYCPICE